MLKRLFFTAFTLTTLQALSSRGYAKCDCSVPTFCGFYLNGSIGGSFLNDHIKSTQITQDINGVTDETITHFHHRFNDNALMASIALGYGFRWSCMYMGLEGYAYYTSHDKKINNTTLFHAKIDPIQYGVVFRPGFLLGKRTLVFGSIGTSLARIVARSSRTSFLSPETSVTLSLREENRRSTLVLGGGLEYALTTCWHIRGDYRYTDYGHLDLYGENEVTDSETTRRLIDDTNIHFRSHDITVGVSRYF